MGSRRSSLSDVLTLEQYRSLLRTAAKIKDREESLTIFFLLSMLGRAGLRIGEAIHMNRGWYDPHREIINVPSHVNCNCGLCVHYANQLADNDANDYSFEEALDLYWSPKDNSDRHVPIEADREIQIIKQYFDEVPYESLSYSTALRRLKKIGELTDGVEGERMYGHMLRATAATHYAWANLPAPALDQKFGWADEKTKERYTEKTALRTKRELKRIRGKEPEVEFGIRNSPPTYSELRPQNEEDLIEVDTWTPECEVPSSPRYKDDEEWLQEELSEYYDNEDSVPAAFDPVTAAVHGTASTAEATVNRLNREWDDLTDDGADWPTPREAAQPTAEMLGSLVLMGILFASTGFSLDPTAGEVTLPSATSTAGLGSGLVGGIVRMLWIDHCTRVEEISFTKWVRRKLGL